LQVPGLRDDQCYQVCRPVNLEPVLAILDRLPFVFVNQGSTDVYKTPCRIVRPEKFPAELKQLIADLGLGGRAGRHMIRELGPRQSIAPHIDTWMPAEKDWRRFQLPITSHPDIIMRWPDDGVSLHLEPGFLYEVRFDRVHEVVHGADVSRLHLQIDQVDATI
jgi:hypothetical protein